jgi:hypothetical protein
MEEPLKVTIEGVITHEYFLCFYGVVVWYAFLAVIEKRFGKQPFVFKEWKKRNLLDFVVTMAIAPLMVVFDDESMGWYNSIFEKDLSFGKEFYLLAGPAYNIIIRLITGFIKK